MDFTFYESVGIITCFAVGLAVTIAALTGLAIGAIEVFSLFKKLSKPRS